MSLASYLLKYLFIHRSCRVPWNEIRLSRTQPPHGRPCYVPKDDDLCVEFNVSHQASLVALAGTIFYSSSSSSSTTTPALPLCPGGTTLLQPQVGIDITCVDETTNRGSRKHADVTTSAALVEYVSIFAEVFSSRELATIKGHSGGGIEAALRLFYTYWALKEAYIKMTGEALLAPWLRELEFTDVQAPDKATRLISRPYTGTQTWMYGKKVPGLRIEIVGFEHDYLVATAARGGGGDFPWRDLEGIDMERDIVPCATGSCRCLSEPSPERRLSFGTP